MSVMMVMIMFAMALTMGVVVRGLGVRMSFSLSLIVAMVMVMSLFFRVMGRGVFFSTSVSMAVVLAVILAIPMAVRVIASSLAARVIVVMSMSVRLDIGKVDEGRGGLSFDFGSGMMMMVMIVEHFRDHVHQESTKNDTSSETVEVGHDESAVTAELFLHDPRNVTASNRQYEYGSHTTKFPFGIRFLQ